MSLNGQVALVTGGAKNLGAEIALQLAPLGVNLALHYNSAKTKEAALKLEATLKQQFPSTTVVFYAADLTTGAAVDKLFDDVLKDFGRIDIVVNTIGMVLKKPISEISEAQYDRMFALVPPMLCSGRKTYIDSVIAVSIQRLHSSSLKPGLFTLTKVES